MKLETYQIIQNNALTHRGHQYHELATQYGTPLYIFDETSFKERVLAYKKSFESPYFETQILYASKALLTKAIGKLIAQLGIGQDVVSGGEIYVGLAAGVPAENMYFHGNNKTNAELSYAIEQGVGTIVIDNRMEISRVNQIANEKNTVQRVLLRLNPGVEAHTHDYIKTAHLDSKFGESVFDSEIEVVIKKMVDAPNLMFAGFHCHIGSQIFDQTSFLKAASEMLVFAQTIEQKLEIRIEEINFGGGFGVYYTSDDTPFDVTEFLPQFTEFIHEESKRRGLSLKKITIEPGRSLVNASGSTLYTVGDIKHTTGGKDYLFIDGGMSDNIRPALYQAKYEAILTNKATQDAMTRYTIAGKACESGDKIIESIELPVAETGDLLLVNGTGAYNYTMASHYNRLPKPAMIHIDGDSHRLTVKRESYEDLMRYELD
ncbi:diaminopimelate decarboxylase [Aerococcaceae bacterium zg-ZUI334]|uniref:diaminopimelate decarboxylase n=1 Tax=Aerococcaceae bacterium zg-252 TaxID=2796928 RepID=UPI001B9AB1EF|nr:diaminopimelate decarboxylase [Aerococcaceae bacterium zg-ZUI334]